MIAPNLITQPMFLHNLNTQIKEHLSDETLTVQKLTRLVGMSRTNLHRKLAKVVDMSVTEFIRFVRLKRAAELLLKHPEWSIYQIALEVGFNSQSYFTKRFREVFGCCPVKWRKREVTLEHV